MFTTRPILSIALIGHLVALTVSAIPSEGDLRSAAGARESGDDAVSSRVRPVLDFADGLLTAVAARAWQITDPVRPPLISYSSTLGLTQNWKMFGNPPTGSEYLRFRYYYYSSHEPPQGARQLVVATDLVFPVAPDTESHLIEAYWEGHRDKAVSNAIIAYFQQRRNRAAAGLPPFSPGPKFDAALAGSFLPVVEFFRDQYTRAHLVAGDQLVRTEAWYGFAPSRPRGDAPFSPQSRAAAIERYYRAPATRLASLPAFQPLDSIEHEADVQWVLIYFKAS